VTHGGADALIAGCYAEIEPDMKISRIRLSDKTSRLHPRHVVPKPAQAHEPEVPVKVREWIRPALASPDLEIIT
jgi:hypothetical protein